VQGAFFGARLWEFAAGMALGAAARIAPAAMTARVSRPGILGAGMFLYFAGLYSYGSMATYALTDGLIATGLFLILAYLARAIGEPRPAAWLAYLGVYSYGLYLIHQPYVTYVGERVRDFSMLAFLGVAGLVIAALVVTLIPLERAVNRAVDALAARLSAHARALGERKAVSG
jgi:peptidoglycan/LPS O-acetylase OafA/YrhL